MSKPPDGPILVTVCGRTHTGRARKENQDSLLVADLGRSGSADGNGGRATGTTVGPMHLSLADEGLILLVADGMGGRAGGAKASALAVSAVGAAMADDAATDGAPGDAFALRLSRALDLANEEIHEVSRRDDALRGMGTTATLAGIHAGVVYLAQVGDSRAYLVRKDELARITRDQSLIQDLIDSGVLSEQEAKGVRDNRILQALGTSPTVKPELTYHDLRREDVLLLCSDGLSRVVGDDEILEVVKGASDCLAACDQLIALANARGGPDNITVLIARMDGDGLGRAQGNEGVARRAFEPQAG
jgi:protein phosphatase